MRYLANENIPLNVLNALRNIDIDIISIKDFLTGAKDEEVLSFAIKENRIIITFDKDFGELIFRKRYKTKGVILLRFTPKSPDYIREKLENLLISDIDFEGHFTVVKEERIRLMPIWKNVVIKNTRFDFELFEKLKEKVVKIARDYENLKR